MKSDSQSKLIPMDLFARCVGQEESTVRGNLKKWGLRPAVPGHRGSGHQNRFSRTQLIAYTLAQFLEWRGEKKTAAAALREFIWNCPTELLELAVARGQTWAWTVDAQVCKRLHTTAEMRDPATLAAIDLAEGHGCCVLSVDLASTDKLVRRELATFRKQEASK